ncbi:type II secretion system protein, partial [Spirochaetes bacterium]|nr:type II secretion system protein [Candidatus Scatousia excrementipullorum]
MKAAFTLAEVLITLGIIGVVAAMTLPSVINKTRNKELHTAFLKTYSELNQIAELFKADYGISVS